MFRIIKTKADVLDYAITMTAKKVGDVFVIDYEEAEKLYDFFLKKVYVPEIDEDMEKILEKVNANLKKEDK